MNRLIHTIITGVALFLICQSNAIAQESFTGLPKFSSTDMPITPILSLLLTSHGGKEGLILNDDPNSNIIVTGFKDGVLFGYLGEKNADGTVKRITEKYEVDPDGQWQIKYTFDAFYRVISIDGNDIKITLEYISDTQVRITSVYKNESPVVTVTTYSKSQSTLKNNISTKSIDCPSPNYSYRDFRIEALSKCDKVGTSSGRLTDPFTDIPSDLGQVLYADRVGNDTNYVYMVGVKSKDIPLSFYDFQCDCYRKADAIQGIVGLGVTIFSLPSDALAMMVGPIGLIVKKKITSMLMDKIKSEITDFVIKGAVCNQGNYTYMVNAIKNGAQGSGTVKVTYAGDRGSSEKPFTLNPFADSPLIKIEISQKEVCGNGKVEGCEECDDGNTVDGDKCSSTCLIIGDVHCDTILTSTFGDNNCTLVPDYVSIECFPSGLTATGNTNVFPGRDLCKSTCAGWGQTSIGDYTHEVLSYSCTGNSVPAVSGCECLANGGMIYNSRIVLP